MNTNNGNIYPTFSVVPESERPFVKPMNVPPTPIQLARGRVGRNDPCPCGSGRKFKRCCYTGG